MYMDPNSSFQVVKDKVAGLESRLIGMEALLSEIHLLLSNQQVEKDWYTVREVAEILDRSEFTVREWARLHRILADKRACGRGNSKEWIISSEELRRIQNEGLLPMGQFQDP